MANTYTQILIQIVFAVQGRRSLISEEIREPLEKYMCGIVSGKKSKPLAVYCNPDHTHILIGLNPSVSISDMARDIKSDSTKWMKENRMVSGNFSWQLGYGAFSHSRSQLDTVVKYILNQPIHHRKTSFKEEYMDLLKQFDIEFEDHYLFEWIED
jgi:putative transposase